MDTPPVPLYRSSKPDKNRLVRVAEGLKRQREYYDAEFMELQQFFMPRRGNFSPGAPGRPRGRGASNSDRKLVNSRSRLALRTLQSGMQAGMTSPARPWFRLQARDEGLRTRYRVRAFLDDANRILRQMLLSSGAYNSLHTSYGDLGMLGNDASIIDETADGFVLHTYPPGLYWLGADSTGRIDTLYVEEWMTVEQIVGRFVYDAIPTNTPDWSVASHTVKRLWDSGNRMELVQVSRIVMPRYERDPYLKTADNKPIASIWWETGDSGRQCLRNSGYDENPIIASGWFREGREVWARGPGLDVLPDVKMLQEMERDKNEAVRRMNRPPMNAPTSMRTTPFSIAPGALNFTDDPQGVRPAYDVNPPIDQMRQDIREVEERINEGLYADLFRMLALSDRRQITAREIEERHEEKLIGLGPVVELQHREKLGPLIRGVYNIAFRKGLLPEPPPELDGDSIEIDYVSVLAQAQKAVQIGSVERLLGFVGSIAGAVPEVLDRLDADAAVAEYADMVGAPTRILREDEAVASLRQQRQQAAAQQQQAELVAKAGPGAKAVVDASVEAAGLLSQTPDPRGLDPADILNRIGVGS